MKRDISSSKDTGLAGNSKRFSSVLWISLTEKAIRLVRSDIEDLAMATVLLGDLTKSDGDAVLSTTMP